MILNAKDENKKGVYMHKRSGGRVKGHYRNGKWIASHYRKGTYVSDFDRKYVYIPYRKTINTRIENFELEVSHLEKDERLFRNELEYEAKQIERKTTGKLTKYVWFNYIDKAYEHIIARRSYENEKIKIWIENFKLELKQLKQEESLEQQEFSKIALDDKRRIERDRDIYLTTVLEREKNRIKPPMYESYFKGSFAEELAYNRSYRLWSISSNTVEIAQKYLARATDLNKANLLTKQTGMLYDKYVLDHKNVPMDEIRIEKHQIASTKTQKFATKKSKPTILEKIKSFMKGK